MPKSPSHLWVALVGLLLVAVVFTGLGFVSRTLMRPYQAASADKYVVELTKGRSPMAVAQELEAKGVIRNASLFYYYGKIQGAWSRMKAGEYEVGPAMAPSQILSILMSGVSLSRPFLVREGENTYEIAEELEAKNYGTAKAFLRLIRDPKFISTLGFSDPQPKSLEGYLYPDTYGLQKRLSQEDIVRRMVRRFHEAWGTSQDAAAQALGMTRDQVITLASVVEKETGAQVERPMIAGVFMNRLRKKMRLQSDPTIIYGIWERYDGNIHKSDILSNHPWNTYVIPALPIGPISNPGRDAIEAVLHPAAHSFLFFVSHNDGTHEFTSTLADHQKAVNRFQINARAREGKSWRDLKKNAATAADKHRP